VLAGVLVSCQNDSEDQYVGDWRRRAPFTFEGRSHAATFVIGNKGYVCCGTTGNKTPVRHVLEYSSPTTDVGQGSWKELKPFPGLAREQAVGFSLKVNGKDYGFMGTGWNGFTETLYKDFWKYDPDKDEWEEVAPLPGNVFPRRGAIAFSLEVGGKEYGYIGCGWAGDLVEEEIKNLYLADFYRFNPGENTVIGDQTFMGKWEVVEGYGGPKRNGAAVFVVNNIAYICTGENGSGAVSEFWAYDPNGRAGWITYPDLRHMADTNPDEDFDDDYGPLRRAFGVGYVVMVNGELRGHIVGGRSGGSNWEYNHHDDLWIQRTSFFNNGAGKTVREGMVAFSFGNGRAFVGMGKSGAYYADDMWEFIPLVDDYIYNDFQ